MIPDEYDDDEAFLYATDIEYEPRDDRWQISVDPESSLVGPETELAVATLRSETPDRVETDAGIRYSGRLLFSAGVVLFVNGRVVLLQRGPNAPVAPSMWQAPAGRCDGPPGDTAVKEFYQELVVRDGDRPAFVTVGDRSVPHQETYRSTLRRCGYETDPAAWTRYEAVIPEWSTDHLSTIEVLYGDRSVEMEMIAYFHEPSSTLELRYVRSIEPEAELSVTDGEYDRRVDLFDPAEVLAMDERDLVPMQRYLVEKLYASLV